MTDRAVTGHPAHADPGRPRSGSVRTVAGAPAARRPATRADVARLAGTSEAVVSYVINGGPRGVAPGTRRRVLEAIATIGYRPNLTARALASGSSGALGLVVPDISNPFFAALAHRLQEAVAGTGRVILLGDAAEDKDRETRLLNAFAARQVDGLLVVGTDGHPELQAAAPRGIPVVVLDRPAPGLSASSIAIDNVQAARTATAHLLAHGHRSVGIIAGPAGITPADDRVVGWRRALDEAGVPVRGQWRFDTGFTREGGRDAGRALLGAASRPRAVLACNEQQAIGLLSALSGAGVRVPDDVAVITIDGTRDAEYATPALSTVVQPLDEIARRALALLTGAHAAPEHQLVDFTLALRASCGAHPIPDHEERNQVLA